MKKPFALFFSLALASPLGAHPHIFVDTGLDLRFDANGRLTEVKITWAYDEFYSLLITEDRGLDPDFDGELTAAEVADLQGFDMQWTEGFNGDLVILQEGQALALSGPIDPTAVYVDGRITTTHVRRFEGVTPDGSPLEIRPYDATYYTAYDISLPVRFEGDAKGCRREIEIPDIDARLAEMRDLLSALDGVTFLENADQPEIGGLLATTVRVSCDIS